MSKIYQKLFLGFSLFLVSTISAQIVTESSLWEAKQMDNFYLLKIKPKVELNEALNDFANKNEILHALLEGSGDLKSISLRNETTAKSKKMNTKIALTFLTGTLSLIDGIKIWDLKGVLNTKNLKAYTGNITSAVVDERVEVYIYPIDYKLHKTTDQLTGKYAFDFSK